MGKRKEVDKIAEIKVLQMRKWERSRDEMEQKGTGVSSSKVGAKLVEEETKNISKKVNRGGVGDLGKRINKKRE